LHLRSHLPRIAASMRLAVPCQAHSFNMSLAWRLIFASMMILVLLYSRQAYAEWVALGKGDSGTIAYVDTGSIQPDGNHVTMWILYDFKTMPQSGPFFPARRSVNVIVQRAANGCSCIRGSPGRGSVVYGEPPDGSWAQVRPESLGRLLWRFACNKE
jgi:hypothetical protein